MQGAATVLRYPASGVVGFPEASTLLGEPSGAYDGAPPCTGTFPLVLFSHGNGGVCMPA
jgi:hypothetical protein